ncbi:MAG: hypothetical protein AAB362_03590 [Patescibacteria group bacterium]
MPYNLIVSIFTFTRFPKSRFGRFFVVFFALIAVGFFILFTTAPDPSFVQKNEPIIPLSPEEEFKRTFKEELNKDADEDGLREWEEAVYKTNAENPDTDGDGTSDGDEIKQNRNPLVKGPKDTVAPPTESDASGAITFKSEKGNLSQGFVEKLMSDPNFMTALENKGVGISESTVSDYIKELNLGSTLDTAQKTPISKLSIISDESETAVQMYFESFGKLYVANSKPFIALGGDDLNFLTKVMETENYGELKKIDSLIMALETIVKDADKLPIPKNILWFHQKETDLLRESKKEFEMMRGADTDPLKALISAHRRIKTKEQVVALHFEELKNWLEEKKFTLGSYGSLFFLGKNIGKPN